MIDLSSCSATPQEAGVKLVCQRCRLLRDHDGPQGPLMISRVLPAAAISNLALLDGGPAKIHELLRGRADYDEQQITDAIRQYEMLSDEAQRQAARSCRRIQEDGFTGCPPDGCLLPDGRRAEFPFELATWLCDPTQIQQLVMARAIAQVEFPGGIIRVQDKLLAYKAGIRQSISSDDMKRFILSHLGMGATAALVDKIFKLLMLDVKVETITPNPDYICFKNGTFNVNTGQLETHSHSHQLLTCIDHDYDPQAEAHAFLRFLDQTFSGDSDKAEKIALLQGWFGYCLTSDTRWQLMLILLGSGANGKTILANVLRAMLGERNVSSASLDRFRQAYVRAELDGKLLNIAADLPKGRYVADGELKAIISGDSIEVSPKYKPSYGIKPYAKIMACANTLPPARDDSEGYARRLLILKFNNVVPVAQRDPHLYDRLLVDMPGIIAWAIQGLQRQREHGSLTVPASSVSALQEYRAMVSPVRAFAEECLLHSGDRTGLRVQDLYGALRMWCKERGLDAGNAYTMGRELVELGFLSRKSGTMIYLVKPKVGFEAYFRPSVITPETANPDSHVEERDQAQADATEPSA